MMFDLVRYNIRFSDFCSFLEDQTNQIKEFVRPELVTSSSAPRFKTAQEELEGLSHITNRKVGREVVDGWGWANDHQGGGKSGYIYLFVSELPAPFK